MPQHKVGPSLGVMLLVAAGSGQARAQARDVAPAGQGLTVYVNGFGGAVHAGSDDPAAMRSEIIGMHGQDAVEMPAFEGTHAEWTGMMACVRGHFAGIPVRIVDRAPAGRDHLMIMVGGRPDHSGSSDGEWGRAPMIHGAVSPRGVAFAFSAAMRFERTAAMCQTVAHEVGHMLGLDHRRDCADLMNGNPCGFDGLSFTPSARRAMATAIADHLGARLDVLDGDTVPDPVEAPADEVDQAEGAVVDSAVDTPIDPYLGDGAYDDAAGGADVIEEETNSAEGAAGAGDGSGWDDPFGTLEDEDAASPDAPAPAPAGCGEAHDDEFVPVRRAARSWRHGAERAARADGRTVRWRVRLTVRARRH